MKISTAVGSVDPRYNRTSTPARWNATSATMTRLRTLLFARRWLALAIVVAALAARLIVPAGMMPSFGADGVTLIVCDGHMTTGMPGMAMPAKGDIGKARPAKSDAPCAFTGLLAATLDSAALPILPAMPLPLAIFLVVIGAGTSARALRLRPPSQGPPGLGAA